MVAWNSPENWLIQSPRIFPGNRKKILKAVQTACQDKNWPCYSLEEALGRSLRRCFGLPAYNEDTLEHAVTCASSLDALFPFQEEMDNAALIRA